MMRIILSISLLLLIGSTVQAQKYPERKIIRKGNSLYEQGKYPDAEVAYRRALEKTPDSYEGGFNLSDALYKQDRFDEAANLSKELATKAPTEADAAHAFYNEGNALFKQRKLEQALEAYKQSLRLNPDDQQAKFNLAYTKKLLEKDKNGGGGGGDNDQNKDQDKQDQDKNQDKNDQNNDKNKDQKDQNQDKQDQDQNKDKQDQQQGESPQNGMSKAEAENILNAMQRNEDNTKQKVDSMKVAPVGKSGKNW